MKISNKAWEMAEQVVCDLTGEYQIDDVWLLNCVKASAAENIQKGIELGRRSARNKAIKIVKTDSGWGTAGHQLGKDLTERFKKEIVVQKVERL